MGWDNNHRCATCGVQISPQRRQCSNCRDRENFKDKPSVRELLAAVARRERRVDHKLEAR